MPRDPDPAETGRSKFLPRTPRRYAPQFAALGAAPPSSRAVDATYALLQQLLPGVEMDPTRLEMGRTYEQVDAGEVNRARGAAATPREAALAARALRS